MPLWVCSEALSFTLFRVRREKYGIPRGGTPYFKALYRVFVLLCRVERSFGNVLGNAVASSG